LPKKGHVCPFQPKYKRRDQANEVGSGIAYSYCFIIDFELIFFSLVSLFLLFSSALVQDASVQVEMDEDLTLRALGDLDKQGTAESYFLNSSAQKSSLYSLNESFQNVAVNESLLNPAAAAAAPAPASDNSGGGVHTEGLETSLTNSAADS
jgi:hypothetical protein